ncbi:hypothetical protein PCE1_003523 [Barthelona sp. PCE]
MPGLKQVTADQFIQACGLHLKNANILELPTEITYIKSAPGRELGPQDPDWFFKRAAAILRRVYIQPGIGLGGFAKYFGAKARNGHARNHGALAARGVIRRIIQNFEKAGLIEQSTKGRVLSSEGRRVCDTVATNILKKTTFVRF